MAQHTPAWTHHQILSASENHRGFFVRDGHGRPLAEVFPRDPEGAEGQRNARLIAAAPDLLEACEAVKQWIENDNDEEFESRVDVMMDIIEPAIAKAKLQPTKTEDE